MSFGMIRAEIPIAGGLIAQKDWFRFFASLFTALTKGAADTVFPISGDSPFVYRPTVRGQVIVSGGTVSKIEISRDGTTYYDTGLTEGVFPLSAADYLRVTYAVAPTVSVFMPL